MKALRRHRWSRLGAAFGVLAVLALAVLAPIHHLHAIERDFGTASQPTHAHGAVPHAAGAGHAHGAPADQPAKAPIRCPVCTLGKMAGLLLPPSLPVLAIPIVGADAPAPLATTPALPRRTDATARPRAPPVQA